MEVVQIENGRLPAQAHPNKISGGVWIGLPGARLERVLLERTLVLPDQG